MSSIGSGPGIGSGPIVELSALRAVGPVDFVPAKSTDAASVPVATSTALDAGPAPVDQDRVATIRKAIATGSYPLVPTKIADAMIAAGMLLRMPK